MKVFVLSIILGLRLHSVFCLQYICGVDNYQQSVDSERSVQTDNYYPRTIVPTNSNIPVTLGINNYLYKDPADDASLVFHEIDVKVIDSYFDSLYVAYPAVVKGDANSVFYSRVRDNFNNLFRIRYSTRSNNSCLASNMIQFKMVFIKEKVLYEYYLGNCNSSELLYEGFNPNSYCIETDFYCYNDGICSPSNYSLAYRDALRSPQFNVIDDGTISVTGAYPTASVSCLDNQKCTLANFSTFYFSEASYTPVYIDPQITSAQKTATSSSVFKSAEMESLSSLETTSKNTSNKNNVSSWILILYFLGF
ncbi:hypothetical protein CANTEDRAFT_93213 [Yamadazyma tenuis ATCC 10573]|uniref:Flo11 domain-containing protein n=1 Tax=Candida tenuis (strain ATCC 10573 / BCRC 21748 / CBS 615 / JCM 9827 / NBRC 10315 / NRRL Y-1498 / VKM Y-70) TaxID=590646 RepID=G3B1I5_CANTC|nr:uncharacterized protein CANTEDRAFT_93213 [Yamadazyma tenuis ATCC 10573]EGV64979.1 hypothetical protein CANTEDRAFT_93213 [Yamadazyma tenuis ATCC 10573]